MGHCSATKQNKHNICLALTPNTLCVAEIQKNSADFKRTQFNIVYCHSNWYLNLIQMEEIS